MKWVAIDLGGSYVKASVKEGYTPSRLTYSRGDYQTTQFSSSVVCVDQDHLYLCDDTILAELLYPESLVQDWRKHEAREQIARAILMQVKEAAQRIFPKEEVGAILLHDKVQPEPWLQIIGEEIFGKDGIRMAMGAEELLRSIPGLQSGYIMLVDFGDKSLKINIFNRLSGAEKISCWENMDLGFSTIDLSELIEEWPIGMSLMPFGRMMERVREALNLGEKPTIPVGVVHDETLLYEHFKKEIHRYAKRCFEECGHRLESLQLDWEDLTELVLVGGAVQGKYLNTLFSDYMNGEGCRLKTYNSRHAEFDATYAMAHAAVNNQKSANSKVTVEL